VKAGTMADNDKDQAERELDAALAMYTAVEPRAGLEERILANMRTQQVAVHSRLWWRWSVAVAAAAIVAALTLTWRSGKQSHPAVAARQSITIQSPLRQESQVANQDANAVHSRRRAPIRRTTMQPAQFGAGAAANPKLDQFPAPRPLSEQEKILSSYVAEYPEQAVLLARARSEALRRDQLEELQAFASGNQTSDSEERNSDTTER